MRLHFNPFITFVNGNDDEGDRNRQCGAALGFDYRVSDDLLFIADYRHTTGESEGNSDQQSVELGMDWEFANDQMLALGTQFEVDGDDEGPDWGVSVSYIIEFAGPRLDSK
jgi:hypothetical protein